jgi:hypothetical protein
MSFITGLTLGAAMLALWLDTRLGNARPETPARRTLHVGLGIVALFVSVGVLSLVHGLGQGVILVGVLTMFLPALTYALLAALWMMRTLAEARGLAGR